MISYVCLGTCAYTNQSSTQGTSAREHSSNAVSMLCITPLHALAKHDELPSSGAAYIVQSDGAVYCTLCVCALCSHVRVACCLCGDPAANPPIRANLTYSTRQHGCRLPVIGKCRQKLSKMWLGVCLSS